MNRIQFLQRVGQLRDAGKSIRSIASELGVHRSRVERALKASEVSRASSPIRRVNAVEMRRRDDVPLVGREPELAILEASIEAGIAGQGGVLMLTGEPGIGKTRLCQEIASIAAGKMARILWGRCNESQATPPFWPWMQLLQALPGGNDALSAFLRRIGMSSADHWADRSALPAPMAASGSAGAMDTELARFQLFNGVFNTLQHASDAEPLVILLENLHAADHLSLLILEFLAQAIDGCRILLVGTYRDLEAGVNEAMTKTLFELNRLPHFRSMELTGFDVKAIQELASAIAGVSISAERAQEIFDKTGGNPLFVTEIGKHLSQMRRQRLRDQDVLDDTPIPVPNTIRLALGQRFDQLSETCREILIIAAVMGREFDFDMLRHLLPNMHEDSLLDSLEEALEIGLLEDMALGPNRYRFHHILMRQVVYERMSRTRRMRLHARIGRLMETAYAQRADVRVDQLLYHFEAAGVAAHAGKVAHYACLAGDQARQLFAYEEAQTYFKRALQVMDERGDEALHSLKASALFGLGRAQAALGQGGDAVANLGKAFERFIELGQIAQAVAIAEYPHLFHYIGEGIARRIVEQTLDLIDPDSHETGRILSRYCRTLGVQFGDYDKAIAAYQTALRIAVRENDTGLEMRTLANGGSLDAFHLHWRQGLDKCLRAIDLAPVVEDDYTAASAHGWAARCHYALGSLESGRRQAAEALRLASKLGDRYWLGTAHWLDEIGAHMAGDWDAAIALSDRCLALSNHDLRFLSTRALLAYQLGDVEQGREYLETLLLHLRRLEFGHAPQFLHSAVATPAVISLISGETDFFDVITSQAKALLSSPATAPLVDMWARVALALVAVQTGDKAMAQNQYASLRPRRGAMLVSGTIGVAADRLLGLLSETAGRTAQAILHVTQAYQFCLQGGYQPEAAWCLYDCGRLQMKSRIAADRQRAQLLLRQSLEMASGLGMKPLVDRLSGYVDNAREGDSRFAASTDNLSPRETDVLRLIARGKTNREISEELFISPSTVVHHVTNILTKTGASNRAEAAVYAALHGLVDRRDLAP